jgi:hypothetical protein
MEPIPPLTNLKRLWLRIYQRDQRVMKIDRITEGTFWSNTVGSLMHDRVSRSRQRATWFVFSNEGVFTYLDMQRDAYMMNMDLGVDPSTIFSNWDRPQ